MRNLLLSIPEDKWLDRAEGNIKTYMDVALHNEGKEILKQFSPEAPLLPQPIIFFVIKAGYHLPLHKDDTRYVTVNFLLNESPDNFLGSFRGENNELLFRYQFGEVPILYNTRVTHEVRNDQSEEDRLVLAINFFKPTRFEDVVTLHYNKRLLSAYHYDKKELNGDQVL